jgi:hypothetical protein
MTAVVAARRRPLRAAPRAIRSSTRESAACWSASAASSRAADGASQIASIAAKLPQIPPNLLRDVSFDQLPPKGSAQREQVEAAIDWYFQQLSIATSSAIQAMSPEGTMPATAPLLSASSHVATSHSAANVFTANVFTANVFTSPPPLVAQMSAMSEVSSIGSSIGSSVVELASSLDLHNLHNLHDLHDLPGH